MRLRIPVGATSSDTVIDMSERLERYECAHNPLRHPLTVPALQQLPLRGDPAYGDSPRLSHHNAMVAHLRMLAREQAVAWDVDPDHRRPLVRRGGQA